MLSEEANNLFKDFCDGSKDGTVLKDYESAAGHPQSLVIRPWGEPIIGEGGREIANLESCFRELINEGYITCQEKEKYQITKEGYDFYDKELSEVK